MAVTQLCFDFAEPQTPARTKEPARIIPFPGTATAPVSKPAGRASIPSTFTFSPYGAWAGFGKRLAASERLRKNREAAALLSGAAEDLTPADMDTLRSYSGWGGLAAASERGVLYDYYTSPPIAALVWRLLDGIQPILKNAHILEPSCGTGVFLAVGPHDVSYTGVELDKRSAAITSRLHPDSNIIPQSYEAFNLSGDTANCFDHVIGNVPFGERALETAFMDMPEEKSLDRYFIARSLDNLKPGGTMALIAHPGILANISNTAWRLSINRKAQFMGAVKLNGDSFNHTHTGIQPDILLFRKHPEDIHRRLQTFSSSAMEKPEPAQKDWINGTYFAMHPNHIMGTVEAGKGQWGSDVVSGSVTPETLQAMLDTFTPETAFSGEAYSRIRDTIPLPEKKVRTPILPLTKDETEAVENKMLSPGSVKTVDSAVYLLNDSYRWSIAVSGDPPLAERINRILAITREVRYVRNRMREGRTAKTLQQAVTATLNAYRDRYGSYPGDDPLVSRFLRNHPSVSGIYDAFIAFDSDILTLSNLYDTNGVPVNGHNRAVEALLFLQQRMCTANAETIRRYFPDETEELIAEMYRNPDIFLSPDSAWQLREDFISGSAWDKIDTLAELVKRETDTANRDKWRYGIVELEKAAGWIPVEEADFSPHSSWIPEEIINAWAGDKDGLDRSGLLRYGNLARNETGKWGIRFRNDHARKETHDGQELTVNYRKGQWAVLNDEIVYYLNMQKQRSGYNDTETFNREHNDRFKNYIANHEKWREELETKYNRIFNTETGVPVKTYPVYLEGWQTDVKTLKPHQWQSVHHLYREGKGISALGTGFGKTLVGIGLHALLKQEGRINRAWFQVPNNKVKDWIKEIHEVLPNRTVGFVDLEMPGYASRDKRYALYQQLANSSYDIILMPESSAGEIQLSPEQDKLITDEVIRKHISEKGEGRSERYLENLKESVNRKLENGKTNRTICFEDFGCDAVFVDEAHRYKNLFTSTLSRETGLNDGRQSAKAMSLFKKAEYTRRTNNGKNVYLLTATPLTNSPLEYFNMLMFIAPEELGRFGISAIDGFIKNFADIETGPAYDWQNGTVTEKKILKGFKNIQTLQNIFFKYTDYQNDPEKINLDKPDAHNRPNVIPLNPEQTGVLQAISAELEQYKKAGKEERRDQFPGQNFLTFYSRMRTASLDLELYDPASYRDWRNPKLETLSNNVRRNYLVTGGGQVIFCDRVFSSDGTFNMHDKIKRFLCDTGFSPGEIVIVNGFTKSGGLKNDGIIEKEVSRAAAAFNKGAYKVIIGSTACIGEGLNLQENSAALHHFDIPFRPSDFIQRNGRIDRQGNTQDSVELHTYMSAGTIDNYSVSLVQDKANWIDQMLKTKSNVFVNPHDESYVDADELLLALTGEWGDSAKAGERRQEMERVKKEKLAEAQDRQRKDNLASLSLLRGSLASYTGDKGQLSYQNRLRKTVMLEKALLNNPTFTHHELVKTSVPFLYARDSDTVIRKGDMLISRGKPREVTALNFKRREFTARPVGEANGTPSDGHITMSIHGLGDERAFACIPQPGGEERKLLQVIYAKNFYGHSNRGLQEKYYSLHLVCAAYNDFQPPVFSIGEDGKLNVKEDRYYACKTPDSLHTLNPFSPADRAIIQTAARKGIEAEYEWKLETYRGFFRDCVPELAALLARAIPRDGENPAENA
jgi:hypothetical protein